MFLKNLREERERVKREFSILQEGGNRKGKGREINAPWTRREADLPSTSFNVNFNLNHPQKNQSEPPPKERRRKDDLLTQLRSFRKEYVEGGGKDGKVLEEIWGLEREVLEVGDEEEGEGDGNDQAVGSILSMANHLTLPSSTTSHNVLQSMNAATPKLTPTQQLEQTLQTINLERETLIASHELRELKMDLKEVEVGMEFEEVKGEGERLKREYGILHEVAMAAGHTSLTSGTAGGGDGYDARRGLFLHWCGLSGQGLEKIIKSQGRRVANLGISCCLFDGLECVRSVVTCIFPIRKEEGDDNRIPNSTPTESSSIPPLVDVDSTIFFPNVPQRPGMHFLIDIRATIDGPGKRGGRREVSIGWSAFDAFDGRSGGVLMSGTWEIPLYAHPINFSLSPQGISKNCQLIPNTFLSIELNDAHIPPTPLFLLQKKGVNAFPPHTPDPRQKDTYEETINNTIGQKKVMRLRKNQAKDTAPTQTVQTQQQKAADPTANLSPAALAKMRDIGKKFAFGIQVLWMEGYPYPVGPDGQPMELEGATVRLVIIDVLPDARHVVFSTSTLEPGEGADGLYGWQFGFYFEMASITGVAGRTGLFEVVVGNVVVAKAPCALFKIHFKEAFDINDGSWTLPLILTNPPPKPEPEFDEDGIEILNEDPPPNPNLQVVFYKPKFGAPPIRKFSPRLVTPPYSDEAFIYTQAALPTEMPSSQTNISIAIDGIRFLPVNVTITKVHARIYSIKRSRYLKKFEINHIIHLDKPIYSPNMQNVNSNIAASELDRTCILCVRIYTLEYFSAQMELVGTSLHPLFLDAETGTTPDKKSKIAMALGAYQLAVFNDRLAKSFMQSEADVNRIPRVPCCTVLARIVAGDQVPPAPDYSSRAYQTSLDIGTVPSESIIYQFVLIERKNFSIRDRLLSLGDSIPKSARQTEASLQDWIKKKLDLSQDSRLKVLEMDLSFITSYNPFYGFKISIDSARNLPIKGYTIAITSFSPAFFVLGEKPPQSKFVDEVIYTKEIDLRSDAKHPRWLDDFHWYRGRKENPEMLAVIQLISVSMSAAGQLPELTPQGWTVIPIFTAQSYVRHGLFMLPLFEGFPNQNAIQECWKDGDWELEDGIHSKVLDFTSKFASINVRICDGRRALELNPITSPISTEYLGHYEGKFKQSGGNGFVENLRIKGQTIEDYEAQMNAAFVDGSALAYVP